MKRYILILYGSSYPDSALYTGDSKSTCKIQAHTTMKRNDMK